MHVSRFARLQGYPGESLEFLGRAHQAGLQIAQVELSRFGSRQGACVAQLEAHFDAFAGGNLAGADL